MDRFERRVVAGWLLAVIAALLWIQHLEGGY